MNTPTSSRYSRCLSRTFCPAALVLLTVMPGSANAASLTLDDTACPVTVSFDGDTARMTVRVKATGMVWKNGESGGDTLQLTNARHNGPLRLEADATTSRNVSLRLGVELDPASGDLTVTLGGDATTSMSRGVDYPYAFFPADGSGFAVLPFFSGYVVPTTEIAWRPRSSHSREEWFGGVDSKFAQGWMCIGDPAADMELNVNRSLVTGQERLGGVFHWVGSNANPAMDANRLSYDRKAIYRFFSAGGYVAQAKRFREFAIQKGWFLSLKEKTRRNPTLAKVIGAPVIYLWGDGRQPAMLDALKSAGVTKALIQMNINNTDPRDKFPSADFPDEKGVGWSKAVRERGYVPGIYDIYSSLGGRGTHSPYSGFQWLWPEEAAAKWIYVRGPAPTGGRGAPGGPAGRGGQEPARAGGGPQRAGAAAPFARGPARGGGGGRPEVSPQMAAIFARDVRIPKQIEMFGVDAIFLDTVCAVPVSEDFDKTNGHPASRAKDIENRQALLAAASRDHDRVTGVEQIKSWAVPYVDWAEGGFWLAASPSNPQGGTWGDPAYPTIMMDEFDPGENLPALLTTGWQVPLWDLTFHDAVIVTPHWHVPNNKFLYCWDIYDLFAIVRGQAPLLNLAYNGDPGTIGGPVNSLTDVRDGTVWDKRMTNPNVAKRVGQTFRNVCEWNGKVGYLEMTNHRILKDDFTVQASEFSDDGGKSGFGVVVNFGAFDGKQSMVGPTWSGAMRGQNLTVPANDFKTYTWR